MALPRSCCSPSCEPADPSRSGNRTSATGSWRSSCAAALALLQLACFTPVSHWQDQRLHPVDVIRQQVPSSVRVTKVDSTRIVLRNPLVLDSSIVGIADGRPTTVRLAEIARVAVRKRGLALSTPVQIGAGVVVVAALVWLIAASMEPLP